MALSRIKLAEFIAKKSVSTNINSKSLAGSVAKAVLSSKLVEDLPSIIRDVSLNRFKSGFLDVKVTSAFVLNESNLKDIEKMIKSIFPKINRISIDQYVDQSLIGGLKLEFPSQILDLSVKNKLDQLIRFTSKERI